MGSIAELKQHRQNRSETTDIALQVRTSSEDLSGWDRQKIIDALVREADLEADIADEISREVQEIIALYLRKLVDIGNRELFINSVEFARQHIGNKDLLELIKAFLYAGRYLKEGDKVILEDVFPEIRDIIFDIVENFEARGTQ